MDTRRVLVVENESLLGTGIEKLLASKANLDVMGVMPADEVDLINIIWSLQPDIVILNKASSLMDSEKLLTLLKDYPTFRILEVSADDNRIRVYDKHEVLTVHTDDLLQIIQA